MDLLQSYKLLMHLYSGLVKTRHTVRVMIPRGFSVRLTNLWGDRLSCIRSTLYYYLHCSQVLI